VYLSALKVHGILILRGKQSVTSNLPGARSALASHQIEARIGKPSSTHSILVNARWGLASIHLRTCHGIVANWENNEIWHRLRGADTQSTSPLTLGERCEETQQSNAGLVKRCIKAKRWASICKTMRLSRGSRGLAKASSGGGQVSAEEGPQRSAQTFQRRYSSQSLSILAASLDSP